MGKETTCIRVDADTDMALTKISEQSGLSKAMIVRKLVSGEAVIENHELKWVQKAKA